MRSCSSRQAASPAGKLFQAVAAGARLLEIRGTFDQALEAAQQLAEGGEFVLVNSLNPDRVEGQKTAAFEIVEELGGVPDVLALPFGGGGNTCAYARGFEESGDGMPRILCGRGIGSRGDRGVSAIRIAKPAHAADCRGGDRPQRRSRSSSLADDEIRDAWQLLAESEGVVGRAVVRGRTGGARTRGSGQRRSRGVRARPGHGLKDPRSIPPVETVQGRSRSGCDRTGGAVSGPAEVHVRAPATTANIGPGFDCAGAALDLWNELELWPSRRIRRRARRPQPSGIRAFERLVSSVG